MAENGQFSINSISTPTNEDVTITFSPSSSTTKYVYTIYNSGTAQKTVEVKNNNPVNIYLTETGNYQIEVTSYNNEKIINVSKSGQYLVDKTAPSLDVGETKIELHKGDTLLVDEGIYAVDNFDGEITGKITNNASALDLNQTGHQTLVYSVSDSAGNITTKTVDINVLE